MFEPLPEHVERIASAALDAAFKVHRQLGPGLLESVYETCMCHELRKADVPFQRQVHLPVQYDGLKLESGLRLDLLLEDEVIVEIKAIEVLLPLHDAQLLTYLKLSGKRLGLLLNFNTSLLKEGMKRIVL
jgi:GxxExxY protein